ncbi:MAG TPA: zf-TFIIB domain-containing protein [Rhizomicrobium sp.]
MKCPICGTELVQSRRSGVEVELCPTCKGMWLSRAELEQLEDKVFDFGDDKKGTLVFDSTVTDAKCPQCEKPLRRFRYRLFDLEMDFCDEGHGFWLEADEDARVLELMKKEESDIERKALAEDRWAKQLRHLRSGGFLDRLRGLLG